ncbi:NAD(P)H-dependent oxidoreductase [Dysgonomonas sp. Marseille-P4677]|uniref:NADPH-dependent FMN reductase n=1 Tax=Dysgonomonas sp. Marseille-P4677 TaxID=2364790 RepID=UPI0019120296|nr:NADPH-dependent FMN reductase [Dysgonomonas sp. Marseille-P4677]MBK5720285.1 NAD(P)H-dependent oxidoreductase [Dysgonomonas sp. Marseille-P4677]
MKKKKIAVLVGSLRKKAYSKSVANCVIGLASDDFDMQIIEIGNLPIYNQDYDDEEIDIYTKFRETIKASDAILIVTAEHNRSIPAVLKNALDVGSRPYGKSVWAGKPGAIISQSYGAIGGFGANHHLRQVTSFLDVRMMNQPECYLGEIMNSLDENGIITSERTIKFLKQFMDAYKKWVN